MKKLLVVVLTAALALTAVMAAALAPDGFGTDGFACDGERVRDGDVIRGEPGGITRRGSAVDPDPVVQVRNTGGLDRMFDVAARDGRMEWLDIRGSTDGARYTKDTRATCENWGEASDRCPEGGTAVAIAAGRSGPSFVFEHLQIHHNPAQCISGLKGPLLRSDLHHCSRSADY